MFEGTDGVPTGPPAQQTSAADAADADRLAGELEEAEEQISAMSSTIKQQVCVLESEVPVTQGVTHCLIFETGGTTEL